MDKLTITLADQTYEISELTLGQLEDIQDAVMRPAANGAFSKSTNRDVLVVALREDYPSVTADGLGKMRLGSIRKVDDAVKAVLKFAGFELKPKKDAEQGEADAG